MSTHRLKPIDGAGRMALADALGDSPTTVISTHLLRRSLCKAWAVGPVTQPVAALVQPTACPAEPTGFGSDVEALWNLLSSCGGWTCIDVPTEGSRSLGAIITRETGRPVRYYGDVYHTLTRPVADCRDEHVRLLTVDDLALLKPFVHNEQGCGYRDLQTLLTEGITACAIVDGRVVAIAHTSARSDAYADIGVRTEEPFRRRGFSSACASLVAREIQKAGQVPTWSTGEDNHASLRVAAKLGFSEIARTTYVIFEQGT